MMLGIKHKASHVLQFLLLRSKFWKLKVQDVMLSLILMSIYRRDHMVRQEARGQEGKKYTLTSNSTPIIFRRDTPTEIRSVVV
jgi:hypothetical protein